MKKYLSLITLFLCFSSFIYIDPSDQLRPYLDNELTGKPKKYRNTFEYRPHSSMETTGLSSLTNSGSGQPSEEGFQIILDMTPATQIVVVDLRRESHGFVNGKPVVWVQNSFNEANRYKTQDEIETEEENLLQSTLKNGKIHLYSEKGEKDWVVESVHTEKQLVESLGYQYKRIPVLDHFPPSNESVQEFVEYVNSLEPGTWLHFHCRGGSGRTTTFMAMYDMMQNAQKVSFDDIIKRQELIGGKDLTKIIEDSYKQPMAIERLEFLKAFYKYCQEVPDLDTPWTAWVSHTSLCSHPITHKSS